MIRFVIALLAVSLACSAQDPLMRHYVEGEHLRYLLKTVNDGHRYQAQADGVVKKNDAGNFIEEYGRSQFVYDGSKIDLPQSTLDFRQVVTLDPKLRSGIPNLSKVHPALIGPITDFMTFYIHLALAIRNGLKRPGDHFYQKFGTPASWADGTYIVTGESECKDAALTDCTEAHPHDILRQVDVILVQ